LDVVYGQACNSTGFNSLCTSSGKPYCRDTSGPTDLLPNFQCVACISNCDCSKNQFCSTKPGEIGQCSKFSKYGHKCYPLTPSQLMMDNFTDSVKCAEVYSITIGNTTSIQINQQGVCIGSKCRYCDYYGNAGFSDCSTTSGMKEERVCVFPGIQSTRFYAPWSPGTYYEDPRNVWWAVFFCLLMIMLGMESFLLYIKFKNRGTGSNRSTKSFNSSHTPSIELQPTHGTISPQHSTVQNTSPTPYDAPPKRQTQQGYDAPPTTNTPPPYSASSQHASVQIQPGTKTNLAEVDY